MTVNINLQGHPLLANQPHSHTWRTYLLNAPQASEQDKSKRQVCLLKSRRSITRTPRPSNYWCSACAHLSHYFCLPDSPRSSHHYSRHDRQCKLQYSDRAHRGSVPVPWGDRSGTISCAKNWWHIWRGIFSGYPQQDHKLHQRHHGGRTYALTRQLGSVDAARAP